MYAMRIAFAVVCAGLVSLSGMSAEAERKTLMSERGKLLFSDELTQPLGKEWRTAKGRWEIVDGVLKGSELKADMHGAVTRHAMPFQNVIIQYSFKLDGARVTSLSINDAKGHCCRLTINATGITVQKDSHDHNKTDKSQVLEKREVPIKSGEWHTVVLEIQGKEMLARLDNEVVAFGAHDALDVSKANFGFTVAGESVSFKNLSVWEALPSKTWEATRAKLLAERSKTSDK